jgi:hypothetical protein
VNGIKNDNQTGVTGLVIGRTGASAGRMSRACARARGHSVHYVVHSVPLILQEIFRWQVREDCRDARQPPRKASVARQVRCVMVDAKSIIPIYGRHGTIAKLQRCLGDVVAHLFSLAVHQHVRPVGMIGTLYFVDAVPVILALTRFGHNPSIRFGAGRIVARHALADLFVSQRLRRADGHIRIAFPAFLVNLWALATIEHALLDEGNISP